MGTASKPAGDSLLLGAHVSIAGGIDKALERGEAIGATAIQVFTRNASRWQARPLSEEAIAAFRSDRQNSSIGYVAAHDSYLINLASPDPRLRCKSIDAFVDAVGSDRIIEVARSGFTAMEK
jgi:deoxyribonuclease-4